MDESYNDLDLELSESDISLCSDEISNYSPSCSEGDSDIESDQNAAVGDDISMYQSPNSENEGFEDHNDIDDIENVLANTPPTAAEIQIILPQQYCRMMIQMAGSTLQFQIP